MNSSNYLLLSRNGAIFSVWQKGFSYDFNFSHQSVSRLFKVYRPNYDHNLSNSDFLDDLLRFGITAYEYQRIVKPYLWQIEQASLAGRDYQHNLNAEFRENIVADAMMVSNHKSKNLNGGGVVIYNEETPYQIKSNFIHDLSRKLWACKIIQQAFRQCRYNPSFKMCKNIFERGIKNLVDEHNNLLDKQMLNCNSVVQI